MIIGNLADRVELILQQRAGERILVIGYRRERRERALENQAAGAIFRGEINHHAAAERLAAKDNVLLSNASLLREHLACRTRVEQQAFFTWLAFALAVAAIVEREDRYAESLRQQPVVRRSIGQIAPVAVSIEYDGSRVR